jgi:hypothetical protein
MWYLLFDGVAAGNGSGDPVSAARAARIAGAFREPHWPQLSQIAGPGEARAGAAACGR